MTHAFATPESRPSVDVNGSGGARDEQYRWELLVPRALHPMQVAIVEALLYLGEPLAPSDLVYVFDRRYTVSRIDYHVAALKKYGALELVRTQQVRGVVKHSYALKEPGHP